MNNNDSRHQGFSLVELILVLLILSVLAGMTIPNFSGTYTRIQLERSAQDLANTMRYALIRAVMKNRRVRLEFNPTFSAYWLMEAQPESIDGSGVIFERVQGRWARTMKLSNRLLITMEGSFIDFYPEGKMDKVQIRLCRDETCRIVSTKEQRGHVWVYEGDMAGKKAQDSTTNVNAKP